MLHFDRVERPVRREDVCVFLDHNADERGSVVHRGVREDQRVQSAEGGVCWSRVWDRCGGGSLVGGEGAVGCGVGDGWRGGGWRRGRGVEWERWGCC